ncbi:MAG: hypothetical protein HQK84_00730 [Nitrospinae bacterium]|nr:hypothetical protein [Nitrospinota bacterium]
MDQSKKRSSVENWRLVLILLVIAEIVVLANFSYQIYMKEEDFPLYQLGIFLVISIWIYIAFLKQRTVDASQFALNEKFKTHAVIESIPLGVFVLDNENEFLFANSIAYSLVGSDLMLQDEPVLSAFFQYDILSNIYENRWGGYTTKGMSGAIDIIVTINPIKDQKGGIIGKLLIIKGCEKPVEKSDTSGNLILSTYLKGLEDKLISLDKEIAIHTMVELLLIKNIVAREKVLSNNLNVEKGGTLHEVLINAITEVKKAYASRKIPMKLEVKNKLKVNAPEAFALVLKEILTNALIFSGEFGKVNVSLKVEENIFEIVIKDSGIGMNPQIIEKAFDDKFVGNNSSDYEQYREGKGLFLAKTILEELGITVRLESKEGAGTSVILNGQVSSE